MDYQKNLLLFTSLFTLCCANSVQAFELIKNPDIRFQPYDVSVEQSPMLNPVLEKQNIKMGLEELQNYYYQLSSPTMELGENKEDHTQLLNWLTNPELIITNEKEHPLVQPDANKLSYYYASHMMQKINEYKNLLYNKQDWIKKQNKLVFILKQVYNAITRLTLGSACYLLGCFIAKYSVREKQLKHVPTAMSFFVAGSCCIGKAGEQFITSICYDEIIQGHLRETSNHLRELDAKIKNLENFNEQLERKLNLQHTEIQSPVIPDDAQSEKEFND